MKQKQKNWQALAAVGIMGLAGVLAGSSPAVSQVKPAPDAQIEHQRKPQAGLLIPAKVKLIMRYRRQAIA